MEISVIIPHYNSSGLLVKALESVAAQTYLPKEVIIIDDFSDKIHLDNLQDIGKINFPFELNIYFQDINKGAPVARNIGVYHSKYDYIALLDADDCWVEDKLEIQMKALGKYDLLYCKYQSIKDKVDSNRNISYVMQVRYMHILRKNLSPVTLLMRKNAFIPFDKRLRRCDDFKMSIEALSKGRSIGFLNIDVAYGHKNAIGESGLTGSLLKMSLSFLKACLLLIWENPSLSGYMVVFVLFEVVKFPIRCLIVFLKK
ncbi:glycosyltransferase family 2 protein [Sphingobacterium detergens]